LNRENAKEEERREKNPSSNPPLKRRAIVVCPFKGAFENSPAFQGWDEMIERFFQGRERTGRVT